MVERLVPRFEDCQGERFGAPAAGTGLFRQGRFRAHSGAVLPWKIECDALTAWDWEALASAVADKLEFSEVFGVPRGGLPFAEALKPHRRPDRSLVLIVDDVLTTGRSMREHRDVVMRNRPGAAVGVVAFARGECPSWVLPMFSVAPWLRSDGRLERDRLQAGRGPHS